MFVQRSEGKPATPTDPTLLNRLQVAEGEVKQLKRSLELVTHEREQVRSDLSALQDSMVLQHEESERKVGVAKMCVGSGYVSE